MIKVYIASAFCKNGQGGNKAGVVLNGDDLTRIQKRWIAEKLGYSETVFVADSKCVDFKFEYFTPKEEVMLCGHATIAAFGVLKYLHFITKEKYRIETRSGVLEISMEDDIIFMEQKNPEFFNIIDEKELQHCFDMDCIKKEIPIQIASTGLRDILVPIKSEKKLAELSPNIPQIIEISKKYGVVGLHLYTMNGDTVICRNFAPLYGIDEEAATGTSNCALAGFLYYKLGRRRQNYLFEQGYNLGFVSEIMVRIVDDKYEIKKISVGGRSKFCFISDLEL